MFALCAVQYVCIHGTYNPWVRLSRYLVVDPCKFDHKNLSKLFNVST